MPHSPDPWGARSADKAAVRDALAGRCQGLPDAHYGDVIHFVETDAAISKWTLPAPTADGHSGSLFSQANG